MRFVLLHPSRSVLEQRLTERVGHIFPATLLQSQIDAFEPPEDDEGVIVVNAKLSLDEAVVSVVARLTG